MLKDGSNARLVCETSSLMPTVKRCLGSVFSSSSNTAFAMAGSKSFEEIP